LEGSHIAVERGAARREFYHSLSCGLKVIALQHRAALMNITTIAGLTCEANTPDRKIF
jgi:hypothetical protein